MTAYDGVWETQIDTPFGRQKATLTLKTLGGKLTGTSVGAMGKMDLKDGKVDGNRASWAMEFMGMSLTADITLDGDRLSGTIHAGGFGKSPITGQRKA